MTKNTIIRKSVFETNSSSTHTITIARGGSCNDKKMVPDGDGNVTINIDEFGWGYDGHQSGSYLKASYILTALHGCGAFNADSYQYEPQVEMLRRVIKDYTGAETVTFDTSGEGYVDHQSYDEYEKAMTDDDTLRRFIFNPQSELSISHDNM